MSTRKQTYKIGNWISIILVVFLIYSLTGIIQIPKRALEIYKSFIAHGARYANMRLLDPITKNAWFAKQVIPNGARVGFTPSDWTYDRVKGRYFLYPLIVINNNYDYFIDFNKSMADRFPDWQAFTLPTGIKIYAKPGFSLVKPKTFSLPYDRTKAPIAVFGGITVLILIVGSAWLARLKIKITDIGFIPWISSIYLLGFFILTFILWIFLALKGSLTKPNLIALWGLASILSIAINVREMKAVLFSSRPNPVASFVKFKERGFLLEFILITILCILLLSILTIIITYPAVGWDSFSHWIMKSKVVFYTRHLDLSYTQHNQYPMLWPLNIAAQFTLLGEFQSDQVAQWTIAGLFLAFIGQLMGAIKILGKGNKWGWLVPTIFLVDANLILNKPIESGLLFSYAEAGFMAFLTLLISATLGYIRHPDRKEYLILGILASLALSSIKFEGFLVPIIITLALILTQSISQSRKLWFLLALYWIPGILINIGWHYWLIGAGFTATSDQFTNFQLSGLVQKIPNLWQALLYTVKSTNYYYWLAGLAIAIFLLTHQRNWSRSEAFLLIVFMGLASLVMFGIAGWTIDLIKNSAITATYRLMVHTMPAFLILLISRATVEDTHQTA
jgi:hypothetical protein